MGDIGDEASRNRYPIAICGMALRLPGGLNTPQELWDFLLAKRDARSRVPETRYNVSAYLSASKKPGTIESEFGYFLDHVDLGRLDASFFSMTRTELEKADPQQRQLLEVTRECFESAGVTDYRGQNIGSYVGSFGEDWLEMFGQDQQQHGVYRVSGSGDFVLANRLSYEWDLKGPSMTIRTACSSAMVGLHEACQAILRSECSSAIVGGSNLILAPGMTTILNEQGVLAPDGSCKSFDASADGYVRAEAVNVIYIKPLADALRDGNPVRAVIRSTATNCDGKTPGMATPSSASHEAVIRTAYANAHINRFADTAFVECHGTGTAVGDPLETHAIGNVFGGESTYIGSIKPNIGHSEGASGISSLIKTALALENRTIPPNIKFVTPNPKIPFEDKNLKVPTEALPWPEDRRERASVNSFGVGGANAHIILESAASWGISASMSPSPRGPALLVYSTNTQNSLKKQIEIHQNYIEQHPSSSADLAYTLGRRREHLPYRAFSIHGGSKVLGPSPLVKAAADVPLIMTFTGQGAQWPQMGRGLLQHNAVFRQSIKGMNAALQSLPERPEWTIEHELSKPPSSSNVYQAEYSQPMCTAVQVALVECFASLGMNPSAVIGHSSGEIAAAFAAGALTSAQAIAVAYYRGVATTRHASRGAMAAIGLNCDQTADYLVPGVVVACDNSPKSVTISGDETSVECVIDSIKKNYPASLAKKLKVDAAYHSPLMSTVGGVYKQMMGDEIRSRAPMIPFVSSVTGSLVTGDDTLGSAYWLQNLLSPVRFRTSVERLIKEFNGSCHFLEVGPHDALMGPLRQTLAETGRPFLYTPSLRRGEQCEETFLSAVGNLHIHGMPVDFAALTPIGSVLTDLPPYPWDHDTVYWYENRLSKEWRHRKFSHHDLLGSRLAESTDFDPSWRNVFQTKNAQWIHDHKIRDDIVFPFAGFVAMAGEAIRQLSEPGKGYSLAQVRVDTALILNTDSPVEIITSLHRDRWTDSLDSDWWEFSISSHNGRTWTKHCVGKVRSGSQDGQITKESPTLSRSVDSTRWYEQMRHVGLNYGPAFSGLLNIKSSTEDYSATASVTYPMGITGDSAYSLHPIAIDLSLQLCSVASSQGAARKFTKLAVPTKIDEIDVWNCDSNISLAAEVTFSTSGSQGATDAVSAGKPVLRVRGLHMSPLGEEAIEQEDRHAAARLVWQPDIDFVDTTTLFRPPPFHRREVYPIVFELTSLCVIDTEKRLRDLSPAEAHFQRYRNWLKDYVACRLEATPIQEKEMTALCSISDQNRRAKIQSLLAELAKTSWWPIGQGMSRVLENCEAIFQGQVEPLEILMRDDTLSKMYGVCDTWDRSAFLEFLGHNKPNLKILEVGAGTGSSTQTILSGLKNPAGQPMYSKYTFTDISAGFFPAAKERLQDFQNLEFTVLDISKDPVEQGFAEGSYDAIFATNVLHATLNLHESLHNVRSLLRPGGRLILQELCSFSKESNYIWGTLPGWWLGDADGRVSEPYVSAERWEMELTKANFSGLDSITLDTEKPYQLNAVMVAKVKTSAAATNSVALLCDDDTQLCQNVTTELGQTGVTVSRCALEQKPPQGQDIIALIDTEDPFFYNITSERFEQLKRFLGTIKDSRILWVTRACQISCKDPRYAQTIGAIRTIRSEMSLDFATCEVDNIATCSAHVVSVFDKFRNSRDDGTLRPDAEFAVSGGTIHIGRFYPFSVTQELQGSVAGNHKTLSFSTAGRLNTLHWVESSLESPGDDEVEVEVFAAGLNFKDVLIAMGIVPPYGKGLGVESAGIVRRVGANVKEFGIGDRVIASAEASLATHVVTLGLHCAKIPDSLSFEDATTMPCVYGTVIYCLLDIGQLEKGQSVLIHSACGGVGIAAIQICQMVGAEIYATVGNNEKVEYLMSTFGIDRSRIFNSRNASFKSDLLRQTQDQGVDLVLNSLSGELLHASWDCVAPFGKMVEIGKRDVRGHAKLAMNVFEANRSYCCVDMNEIIAKRPKVANRLLKQIIRFYEFGHIQPVRPIKIFAAPNIVECFRYMQKGQHTGKIVVSMTPHSEISTITNVRATLQLNSDASYLLAGGVGGLGKAMSLWMVENGARNLLFLSRSAGKKERDHAFSHELENLGCSVQMLAGDVAKMSDVRNAVRQAERPIAGIIQLSMVLNDDSLMRMTHEAWHTAISPKVTGTLNLHEVSQEMSLDFFVLLSSLSGIVGLPGQANYASAGTFLDAFVQYRHSMSLPASVLDLGAVEDVGFVAETVGQLTKWRASAGFGIREQEMLDAMQLAMMRSMPEAHRSLHGSAFVSTSQMALGLRSAVPLADPSNRLSWKKDPRMAIYHNVSDMLGDSVGKDVDKDGLMKQFLRSAKGNPAILEEESSVEFLAQQIGKKLLHFQLRSEEDVDITCSLKTLGMDSLIAIEMRNWWRQTFDIDITILELLGAATMTELGEQCAKGLGEKAAADDERMRTVLTNKVL